MMPSEAHVFSDQLLSVVPFSGGLSLGVAVATAALVSPVGRVTIARPCVCVFCSILLFLVGSESITVARGIHCSDWLGLSHVAHPAVTGRGLGSGTFTGETVCALW